MVTKSILIKNLFKPKISVSVVSTSQILLIKNLLDDIENFCKQLSIELILTLNQKEEIPFDLESFSFPIRVIHNINCLGFARNHNKAFACAKGDFFCVINPDIRFNIDPFSDLVNTIENQSLAMAAPLVLNSTGEIEDSVRRFPSPASLFARIISGRRECEYPIGTEIFYPDWVGGMFILFRSEDYAFLSGFDEKYFLYFEDVDICARAKLQGCRLALNPQVRILHQAQRSSHRSLRYFKWHLTSALKYFLSPTYWRLMRSGR